MTRSVASAVASLSFSQKMQQTTSLKIFRLRMLVAHGAVWGEFMPLALKDTLDPYENFESRANVYVPFGRS